MTIMSVYYSLRAISCSKCDDRSTLATFIAFVREKHLYPFLFRTVISERNLLQRRDVGSISFCMKVVRSVSVNSLEVLKDL
jgi:hypothetical protein